MPSLRIPRSVLSIFILLGSALCSCASAADAPAASKRIIDAHLAQERGPMNRMHNFCVGAGRSPR
jgi:hypothetical protein